MSNKKYQNYHSLYDKKQALLYNKKIVHECISGGKISLARKILGQMLQEDPYDYILLKELSRILIFEKEYEEAKTILEELPQEKVYKKLVALAQKLGAEEELYELYQKYFIDEKFNQMDSVCYQAQKLYLTSKFNPNLCSCFSYNYFERQIVCYDENWAISHIKANHTGNKKIEKTQFDDTICIEELFFKVKEFIQCFPQSATISNNLVDNYQFYYPMCGKDIEQGRTCNYFLVQTFINQPYIITMYPISLKKYFDICHLEREPAKKNIKIKNGLERFYGRYKKD